MSKIKELFAIKRNVIIAIATACVVVAIAIAVVVLTTNAITGNKPPVEVTPVNTQSSSTLSSKVSSIVVPEIVVDKDVSSAAPSSEVSSKAVSSKEPDLKVEGNPSSTASSKSPVKTESKPQSIKPVSSKPVVSSAPPPPPPVSSEVEAPPVEPPPHNPDGPQHGDTRESSLVSGNLLYYHVGIDAYIPEEYFINHRWGEHPEATSEMFAAQDFNIYLKNGDVMYNGNIWCGICKGEIRAEGWNSGKHAAARH